MNQVIQLTESLPSVRRNRLVQKVGLQEQFKTIKQTYAQQDSSGQIIELDSILSVSQHKKHQIRSVILKDRAKPGKAMEMRTQQIDQWMHKGARNDDSDFEQETLAKSNEYERLSKIAYDKATKPKYSKLLSYGLFVNSLQDVCKKMQKKQLESQSPVVHQYKGSSQECCRAKQSSETQQNQDDYWQQKNAQTLKSIQRQKQQKLKQLASYKDIEDKDIMKGRSKKMNVPWYESLFSCIFREKGSIKALEDYSKHNLQSELLHFRFQILYQIYDLLTKQRAPGRSGSHWIKIGFQNPQPNSDLRGMGMLGLYLIYKLLVLEQDQIFKLFVLSCEKERFPFMVTMISLGHIVLTQLKQRIEARSSNDGEAMELFYQMFRESALILFEQVMQHPEASQGQLMELVKSKIMKL